MSTSMNFPPSIFTLNKRHSLAFEWENIQNFQTMSTEIKFISMHVRYRKCFSIFHKNMNMQNDNFRGKFLFTFNTCENSSTIRK